MIKSASPYLFDEFFSSGKEESISPFLYPESRKISKNLSLKIALLSAFCLALSFSLSFTLLPVSNLFLASVYFLSGTPALISSLKDIRNLEINIDVLMILAALLSVVIGSGMEGALLLVLFEFSGAMENSVTQKTKGALSSLHALAPTTAFVVEEGNKLIERSIKEIEVGTLLLVKAGEIVPLDGVVVDGHSFVDLVHLTGESTPASKRIGDEVPAGARNLDGTLTIKVLKISRDSTLAKIIELITTAQESKPRLQQFFDRFGKYYATSIICLSAFFALALPLFFHSMPYFGIEGSIYRALAFLIAASPCALIIAIPTAYLSAISACAKRGILLKGGVILDMLSKCSVVAFDKTGTLTTGELTCTEVKLLDGQEYDLQTAISIGAVLERSATHPIAKAICQYAEEKKAPACTVKDFQAKAGFGLQGNIMLNGKEVMAYIGHPSYILDNVSKETQKRYEKLFETIHITDKMSALLLIGNSLYIFYFIDTLRKGIGETLKNLKEKYKMRLVMLTGDHEDNAKAVAKNLPIDEVCANLRPEEKLNKVISLGQHEELIMVGDGVNDAPALARASVGISMGKIGSATAVEASDAVFLQDDFALLSFLVGKAHHTLAIVKQNLTLALIVILFATTPALLGLIPLWLAVILHEGGTVLVGLNSLRLLRRT